MSFRLATGRIRGSRRRSRARSNFAELCEEACKRPKHISRPFNTDVNEQKHESQTRSDRLSTCDLSFEDTLGSQYDMQALPCGVVCIKTVRLDDVAAATLYSGPFHPSQLSSYKVKLTIFQCSCLMRAIDKRSFF